MIFKVVEKIDLADIRLHRFDDDIKVATYWHIDTMQEIDESLIPSFSYVDEQLNPEWL